MPLIILTTTDATLLLNANPKRRKLPIQMQAADVDANNTGRIHLGLGPQPSGVVGHPNQGLIIVPAAGIEEPSGISPIDERYKQAIWAVSSVANQSLTVDEETESS